MRAHITRRQLLAAGTVGAALATLPVAAQESGELHEIEIKNFRFKPAKLEVRPGDRIRWTNRDGAPHNATALDQTWKTRDLSPDQSAEVTMSAGSGGDYFCSIHPSMRAVVTIRA
jgi:plastocyanin